MINSINSVLYFIPPAHIFPVLNFSPSSWAARTFGLHANSSPSGWLDRLGFSGKEGVSN
jgi:hypothetical protein